VERLLEFGNKADHRASSTMLIAADRIAELEADNERLRTLVMAQSRAIHSPEALSRTGGVKVGYANSTAPGNPFVTPATEGQQPVAWVSQQSLDSLHKAGSHVAVRTA